MPYVPSWERLPAALERIMTAAGLSKDDAQSNICRALADRVVRFRGQLKKHTTSPMRASAVLEGGDFDIPTTIRQEDLDWEQSRPVNPWVVRREHFRPPGYWELAWIELFRADVTNALCAGPPGEFVRQALVETGVTSSRRPTLEGTSVDPGPRSSNPQSPGAAGSPRRRGAQPKKFEQTKAAMRDDIQQQRRSVAQLKEMLEKDLSATYGVSRDTARKARKAVLSEFGAD